MSTKKKKNLPAGIEQLAPEKYRVRIYFEGKQHSLGNFRTIGDAKAAQAIALSEKARGIFVPPAQRRAELKAERQRAETKRERDSKTLRQLAEAWLTWLENTHRSAGTIYTYRRHLEAYFLPEFASHPVTSITSDQIADWHQNLSQTKSDHVARQAYLTASAMFRYGTGESKDLPRNFKPWLATNPCDIPGAAKKRPQQKTGSEPVATPDDIAQIADNMPAREALGILLAGWCALRIGELLALRRRHITRTGQKQKRITWINIEEQVQARGSGPRIDPPKSAAGNRTVPVPKPLVPVLEDHLNKYVAPEESSLLFPRHEVGNEVHHPNTYRNHFNVARDAVMSESISAKKRLDGMTFHGLRHSCLTRLGQAGATLSDLMAFAGHSDVESVLIYQHSERERLASLTETMAEDFSFSQRL